MMALQQRIFSHHGGHHYVQGRFRVSMKGSTLVLIACICVKGGTITYLLMCHFNRSPDKRHPVETCQLSSSLKVDA